MNRFTIQSVSGRSARVLLVGAVAVFGLAACATQNQNTYRYDEVGRSKAVSFGTVVASRVVDIKGQNTGVGAGVGAAVGAGAASGIGSGSGNAWATGAGLLAGAVLGAMIEQSAADRQGVEYVVTLETGVTLTIVQEMAKTDKMHAPGDRVMVQTSGGYQRVLPADHLPTEIQRPQGIKVVD
ncbi:MAG: hypothetical protein RLY86_1633 [Pseudomonadota bacterium]|jgi:outer membrane lipoprotein SlyB